MTVIILKADGADLKWRIVGMGSNSWEIYIVQVAKSGMWEVPQVPNEPLIEQQLQNQAKSLQEGARPTRGTWNLERGTRRTKAGALGRSLGLPC